MQNFVKIKKKKKRKEMQNPQQTKYCLSWRITDKKTNGIGKKHWRNETQASQIHIGRDQGESKQGKKYVISINGVSDRR